MKRLSLLAGLVAFGCYSGERPGSVRRDAGALDLAGPVDAAGVERDATADASPDTPDSGDASDGSVSYLLCDGTERLRFRAMVELQVDREIAGSAVRVENGFAFFMVDGTCRYWISGGWIDDPLSRDRPIMTGKLGAADQQKLQAELPLDRLGELADCTTAPGQSDVSVRAIRGQGSVARCGGQGARFDAAWATVATMALDLWRTQASPTDGDLRITAVAAGDGAVQPAPYPWPPVGVPPLADFFVDRSGPPTGVSHLVSGIVAVTGLRALRAKYLTDRGAMPGLYASWDGLRAMSGQTTALVFMRDALPYEDERGLITF